MRKIIGVSVAFCFFINNFSFALTPALKFGSLGGETYHDKFLYYAEAGLQKDLVELNSLSEIRGVQNFDDVKEVIGKNKRLKNERISSPEKTIFDPLKVKTFFNQLEHAEVRSR